MSRESAGRERLLERTVGPQQARRAGRTDATDMNSGTSARKASRPECTSPFGPSIHAVAGSRYVTMPGSASTIRSPVSRETDVRGARPLDMARTCSMPGSAASPG